jgi:hypothetical protein
MTKFDREIARFRGNEADYRKRGILLMEAAYPRAVVALFGIHLPFSPLLFGLDIDFANYDTWPVSVRFINPFTGDGVTAEQLPNLVPIGKKVHISGEGVDGEVLTGQPLVQSHAGHSPFLCHRGVREYHNHPAHSGDPWALHRGSAEGRLARIIELVHKYGVAPAQPTFQVQARFAGYQVPQPVE